MIEEGKMDSLSSGGNQFIVLSVFSFKTAAARCAQAVHPILQKRPSIRLGQGSAACGPFTALSTAELDL